jgi:hypothetical protein
MVIIKISDGDKNEEEDTVRAEEPEIISIEEEFENEESLWEEDEELNEFIARKGHSKPLGKRIFGLILGFVLLRLFLLFILAAACIWLGFTALMTLSSVIINVVTLGQSLAARDIFYHRWRRVKLIVVCIAGLLVAFISVPLGLTLIASYSMMNFSDDEKTSFFVKFLESRLKDFEE